jgi:hypothetical protein
MVFRRQLVIAISAFAMLFATWPQVVSAEEPSNRTNVDALPMSDICLMPIPGTGADVLGFAVGDMIEAPKNNGVLIDTVGGLFHQRLDGSIESLQPRTGQYTRTLAALPWSDEVVAVGVSETIVRQDLSVEEVFRQRSSELFGIASSIQSVFLRTAKYTTGRNPFFGRDISYFLESINVRNGKYRLVPSETKVPYGTFIVDAPWFGTPIVWEESGPFSIDREGILRKFDIEEADPEEAKRAKQGIPGGMNWFAHQFFSVPRFRTLYVRTNGWFRITPNQQALRMKGLSADITVLDSFDPGSGDALFATTAGIFAVGPDGVTRALIGSTTPRQLVHVLVQDPTSEFVLAGGEGGLLRIQKDSLEIAMIPHGSADIIGSVKQIIPVGFADLDLVVTSNGTYSFEGGKLETVPLLTSLSPFNAPLQVSVLPHLKRALINRRNDVGPMIYELRRSGPDGACGMPLASASP